MIRKANCAANVSRNTPQPNNVGAMSLRKNLYESRYTTQCVLDARCMCGIIIATIGKPILGDRGGRQKRQQASKVRALLEEGTLNPAPGKVQDPKFHDGEFFDPRDIVQVKYEMLRRVSVENASVTSATEEYSVSRPTYYQTKASFEEAGIAGLVPRKRGPRGPHKVRGAVLAFVQEQLVAGEPIRARQLAKQIRKRFDLDVHPRTIERAVAVKKTAP